jgi:hypothetical protein
MMVNCPKCNLLQPKDQYCANCGVNMETWQPPAKPLWKKVLGNWMVQLSLLFVVIFAIVLRDNISQTTDSDNEVAEASVESWSAPSPPPAPSTTSTPPAPKESPSTQRAAALREKQESPSQVNESAEQDRALEKKASLRVMLVTRALIERLSQASQRQGESAMLIPRNELDKILNQGRRDFQLMGAMTQRFEWDQNSLLFVGEEDLETGLNLGFYMQINVNRESNRDLAQIEARHWSLLQLSGEPTAANLIDLRLPKETALLVLDLNSHELDFSQEERTLFEASQRLRQLNEASFIEGLSEIALILLVE